MPEVFAQRLQVNSIRAIIRNVRICTTHLLAASVISVAVSLPAKADAPRTIAMSMVCSLNGRFCAFDSGDGRSVEIRERTSKFMRRAWRANVVSPHFMIGNDGRSLVEMGPGLNLVDRDAQGITTVLIFYRPGNTIAPLRLRDISLNPARLPVTVSHRIWARAYGYDGRGSFVVQTHDGRSLRFDPATGRER